MQTCQQTQTCLQTPSMWNNLNGIILLGVYILIVDFNRPLLHRIKWHTNYNQRNTLLLLLVSYHLMLVCSYLLLRRGDSNINTFTTLINSLLLILCIITITSLIINVNHCGVYIPSNAVLWRLVKAPANAVTVTATGYITAASTAPTTLTVWLWPVSSKRRS